MKTKRDEGWSSTHCTKCHCRTFLDPGAGVQFVGERGKQERFCTKHWREHNNDHRVFVTLAEKQ